MLQIGRTSLCLAIFLLLMACKTDKECINNSNEKLLQEYQTNKNNFVLLVSTQGAFGSSVILKVCDLQNNRLIEEVTLRGEDYLPKIDM